MWWQILKNPRQQYNNTLISTRNTLTIIFFFNEVREMLCLFELYLKNFVYTVCRLVVMLYAWGNPPSTRFHDMWYLRCLRLYRWRVETKTNGHYQPFERIAQLVGSLIPNSEITWFESHSLHFFLFLSYSIITFTLKSGPDNMN